MGGGEGGRRSGKQKAPQVNSGRPQASVGEHAEALGGEADGGAVYEAQESGISQSRRTQALAATRRSRGLRRCESLLAVGVQTGTRLGPARRLPCSLHTFSQALFEDRFFGALRSAIDPLANLGNRQRVNHTAPDLNFQVCRKAGSAFMFAKNPDSEPCRLKEGFSLHLA